MLKYGTCKSFIDVFLGSKTQTLILVVTDDVPSNFPYIKFTDQNYSWVIL